jgi:hypothetical protein
MFFVQWVYTGHVWTADNIEEFAKNRLTTDDAFNEFRGLTVSLWLLGDRLLAEEFQNHCMDMLRKSNKNDALSTYVLCKLQDSGLTESLMHDYITKQIAFDGTSSDDFEDRIKGHLWKRLDANNVTRIFLESRILLKTTEKDRQDPARTNDCKWHVHVETSKEECMAKGKR